LIPEHVQGEQLADSRVGIPVAGGADASEPDDLVA
jgi:hypothetical protein